MLTAIKSAVRDIEAGLKIPGLADNKANASGPVPQGPDLICISAGSIILRLRTAATPPVVSRRGEGDEAGCC